MAERMKVSTTWHRQVEILATVFYIREIRPTLCCTIGGLPTLRNMQNTDFLHQRWKYILVDSEGILYPGVHLHQCVAGSKGKLAYALNGAAQGHGGYVLASLEDYFLLSSENLASEQRAGRNMFGMHSFLSL